MADRAKFWESDDRADEAFDELPFGDPPPGDTLYDPLDPDADCFKPPHIPTEVHCLHCDREYESYLIEWVVRTDEKGRKHGFWCCPTPGCGGAGFGFDLLPTDPDYVDEHGEKFWCNDDEDFDDDEPEGPAPESLDFDTAGDDFTPEVGEDDLPW